MKKKEVQQALQQLLSGMYQHDSFKKELNDLINSKKGCEEDLFSDLITQFKELNTLGVNIHKYNGNEILKESGGMISLHLKRAQKYNIRILLKFKVSTPYLLCAFEELGRKRKDRSGYKKNIEIANQRFKSIH